MDEIVVFPTQIAPMTINTRPHVHKVLKGQRPLELQPIEQLGPSPLPLSKLGEPRSDHVLEDVDHP